MTESQKMQFLCQIVGKLISQMTLLKPSATNEIQEMFKFNYPQHSDIGTTNFLDIIASPAGFNIAKLKEK
jgi:hypothetical protein